MNTFGNKAILLSKLSRHALFIRQARRALKYYPKYNSYHLSDHSGSMSEQQVKLAIDDNLKLLREGLNTLRRTYENRN